MRSALVLVFVAAAVAALGVAAQPEEHVHARGVPPGQYPNVPHLPHRGQRSYVPRPNATAVAGTVSVASWNLQVFGQTKAGKPEVMKYLVDVLSRFDLIAVQEIRDAAGTAITKLVDELNAAADGRYGVLVGPREGSTSSKEQYAFIYSKALFSPLSTYRYADSNGTFERPPWAVELELSDAPAGTPPFLVVNVHTKPDAAVKEISALADVYEAVAEQYHGNTNVLTVGDYNCGCSYVTKSEYSQIRFYTETQTFKWYIPNSADTMVSSDCPYDRIVVGTGEFLRQALVASTAGAFDFEQYFGLTKDEALDVSDHLPVVIDLRYDSIAARA